MKARGWIEPIVERVVGQVLDSHAAQLRTEIVRRVMEEIAAQAATEPEIPASAASAADLARAVAEIQLGTSQREVLRALLDACAGYAARVALFVVKGGNAAGWQGRGFAQNDALKDFSLDANAPAVVRALNDRAVVNALAADVDSRFLEQFGTPARGEARILPLVLKDKVAALVYADGGTDGPGPLDAGALELLVLATSAWLEVNSLRKQARKDSGAGHGESRPAMAGEAAPAFTDPFAGHAPSHAMAAAASAEAPAPVASAAAQAAPAVAEAQSAVAEDQSAMAEAEPALADPLPAVPAEAVVATEPAPPAAPSVSPEDQEIHRKAHRFARLLVDEIKLYNQAKVAEGRKHKDLYDRLKEAIEKSRTTYQKRYGSSVAASANYFQDEVIRSLAEDDLSIMGANFRR